MSNIKATFSINAAGTVWGAIDGDLSNQTDLQDALDLKADKTELETDIEEVNTAISNLSDAVSDNYTDLDDKISGLTNTVNDNDTEINSKVDGINTTLTNSINNLSNTVSANTNNITINSSDIITINSKIPSQASSTNQLADKNFVNSSIATSTSNFIGTFNSVAELEAYSGTLTNNDYAFVATTDTAGNTLYDRYKWNGSEWLFEYELNNSSFTANQWAAINSGITDTLTAQITTNQNAITNIQNNYVPNTITVNGKALSSNITLDASDVGALSSFTTINDLTTTAQQNALNSGATSAKISQIATNTGNITTNTNAILAINGKIPTDTSSSNKLVTASALSNAVVDLANKDLSNLSNTGNNRLHALKGYSDEGELLTDAEGLADVTKYAHSTFDLSKFTVVGSPTITDDGIITFSNNSNRAYHPISYFGDANRFDIIMPLYITGYNQSESMQYLDILNLRNGNNNVLRLYTQSRGGNYCTAVVSFSGVNGSMYFLTVTPNLEIYKQYFIKISKNGNTYGVYYKTSDSDWLLLEPNRVLTSSDTILNFDTISFTQCGSYENIDLKQFSITVDGVEVFSGNKTGIDVIKPDDYTVVGSPTITDGVITVHDNNNYVTGFKLNQLKDKSFRLEGKLKLPNTTAGEIFYPNVGYGNYSFGLLYAVTTNYKEFRFNLRWGNSSSSGSSMYVNLRDSNNGINFNVGDVYEWYYELEFPNVLKIGIRKEGTSEWITKTMTDSTYNTGLEVINAATDATVLQFGKNKTNNNYSFDLNSFKIYVDGNLIYQPCLKIPYTESKTGSKIVGSDYRDRVNDMAEQFGYAPYYTLSDTDFTLPQGELYGMIGEKTLRDSYYNGVTYWELYSNRRLEQGGTCESGIEYTLPKPFANGNYVLTIPYSSKTATSFIPSATGDFIAKGTGLL